MLSFIQAATSASARLTPPSASRTCRVSKRASRPGCGCLEHEIRGFGIEHDQGDQRIADIPHGDAVDVWSGRRMREYRFPFRPRFRCERPAGHSALCLSMGMPSPTLRVVRVVVKGSVTRAKNSGAMPHPSSRTENVSTRFSSTVKATVTSVAPALILFWTISERACSNHAWFHQKRGTWPGCPGCPPASGGRIPRR